MTNSLDIFHLFCVLIVLLPQFSYGTRLRLSVPIPQVKMGGMLSVYCRIWELSSKQLVTLSRDTGAVQVRLTWGDYVQQDVDERTFLAVRHLGDGSVVHFLTIVNAKRDEEGNYSCSIRDSVTLGEIVGDTIPVRIEHPPGESYPICFPSVPLIANEGNVLAFNCTSEAALPVVNIAWSRTGARTLSGTSKLVKEAGMRTLTLETQVSLNDNGAIFVCTVSSSAFPEYSKTCHIGPLQVTRNPWATFKPKIPGPLPFITTQTPDKTLDIGQTRHETTECKEYCSSLSSPAFYWIVATVVAGSFAFLFLFMTSILIIKYCRSVPNGKRQREMQIYGTEDIYSELDTVPEGVKQVYMSLKKPVQVGTDTSCQTGKGDGDVYTSTAAFNPDSNF